ncbi:MULTISPECIES: sulfatase-like hydrolase/transferase [unclassified Lentimonas]|uniref:sulfatase-like hydrolase/transferase n=1 Tax=unclassified Lentimonas TaxID=2630993 RepID=UPI0013249754|nr:MULTISPECIES: sulfatase-like hydrolase/transferase [unclassified Lentimonas]CAA6692722.1 Choline-sulfatase (EC [Lentimonas sp. CC10]CAA6696712.1 Choline-sulfatase (EC [Lentimonas sp. CC19]CAA7072308.1 Choline-sulfatase (EC [Lentimonas sp. CC11]
MKLFKQLTALLCLTHSILTVASGAETKPNLLFIVTDEHNFRTLGCYRDQLSTEQAEVWGAGNVVETPYIDSIAKNGALFDRMYASAPVCTPARASMFTGMYGHQLGIPNNSNKPGDGKYLKAEVTTIAEVLRDEGYMTGYIGKWHLAEARKDHKAEWWQPYPVDHPGHNYGFVDNKFMFNGGHQKWYGIDADGNPYRAGKNPTPNGTDATGQPVFKDKRSDDVKYATDWLTDRAIDFIEKNKDQPFYCVVSIPDPHTPDEAREPYYSMYKDMPFELPHTYNAPRPAGTPKWQMPDGKAKTMLNGIPHYFGMVKCIDDNIGRILKSLEDEGILENTIIVFASDHGDLYGEHARMNKGTIHETSARVPFIMAHGRSNSAPLIPRGKVVREAGNTTDWMPTFLSLLQVDCPEVAGRDLSPLMGEKIPEDWDNVTFSQLGFMAAIDSRHKLYLAAKAEPWLLDTQVDPYELNNLINDPAYADVVKNLALELQGYMQRTDAESSGITDNLNAILSKESN